jgi:hypothetical protein
MQTAASPFSEERVPYMGVTMSVVVVVEREQKGYANPGRVISANGDGRAS